MRKFADMPSATRAAVLLWARSHDWGFDAVMAPSSEGPMMTGLCCTVSGPDGVTYDRPTFADLDSLRAWAGY